MSNPFAFFPVASGRTTVRQGWAVGLAPDPVLLPAEWAERHRVLSSKISKLPGPWDPRITPYAVEILNAMHPDSGVEGVVVQKGRQLGFTDGVALNSVGYYIDQAPGPLLYVMPTMDLAKRLSKGKLSTMLDHTAVLKDRVITPKSRVTENTMLYKEFSGGSLALTGANSPAGFRELSSMVLFGDELDGWKFEAGEEGSPLELARGRLDAFEGASKQMLFSTPTIRDFSAIEREFARTDQRYYNVPCPHCHELHILTWANFRMPTETSAACMACPNCGGIIEEAHKYDMLQLGVWIPTATAKEEGWRGYHISGLYSLLRSWRSIASQWVRAQESREALKVFVNQVLAETWEDAKATIAPGWIAERQETYPEKEVGNGVVVPLVPKDVLAIFCGVDTQDDRYEIITIGCAKDEVIYGLEYRVVRTDTSKPEAFKLLEDALIHTTYEHELGYTMPIHASAIDSGGHRTREVYLFAKRWASRRIYATKGYGAPGVPMVGAVNKKRSGKERRPVKLHIIGTDDAWMHVQDRLRIAEPGPGFVHFPFGRGFTPEFFEQLTALRARTKYIRGIPKRVWEKPAGRRAEAWDCLVEAYVAMYLSRLPIAALEKIRAKRAEQEPPPAGSPPRQAPKPTPTRPVRSPRRHGTWVTGWKK